MASSTRTTPSNQSYDELPQAIKTLCDERDWSLRELWRQIERKSGKKSLSVAGLHAIATGEIKPTMSSLEKIASGFGINPEYFAEYRLASARRELDPEVVGLARALRALHDGH